jgi:HEAT repeat protein
VKFSKTGYFLISVCTLITAVAALNHERLFALANEMYTSLIGNEASSEPPSKIQNNANSSQTPDQIKQLLQQKAMEAMNPPPLATDSEDPEDLKTMEEALNDFYSSEDEQDRESALMILGEYPDPKAKEAILYALNDPEDAVREQAVSQIGNWEDEKERQQMLLTALQNDHPDIVVLALESVAEIDDPALAQKIKELSNNKNEDISEAAKVALDMADSD